MARSNVEILREDYEAISRDDYETLVARWDPEIVIDDPSRPDPSSPDGCWRGYEGWRRYSDDWMEVFEEFRIDPEEFTEAGDHVIVRVRAWGRSRTGVEIENRRFHLLTIRGGKVVRFGVYENAAEARRAAELPAAP